MSKIALILSFVLLSSTDSLLLHSRASSTLLQSRICQSHRKSSTALSTIAFELQSDAAVSTVDQATIEPKDIALSELRKAIPEAAFQKSLPKSLAYMFFDYAMWGGATYLIYNLVNSPMWATLPFIAKAAASLTFWGVAGFFMWCIFVVGHDCGHTTFSNNKWINNILGHVTHGSLLVPFFPWQLSHRRHHMFHNHIDKDYSYQWFTEDKFAKNDEWFVRHFHKNPLLSLTLPFYGWFMYLLGVKDGNHFFPISSDKLWSGTPKVEYSKCLVSSAVVALYAGIFYNFFGGLANMAYYYLAPLVVFGWWLVTVTYLQHHNEDPVVYDNDDYRFAQAAFETVDRKYGFGIDKMHHHITDGHVAHHLFFTQIPHYNLPMATEGIKAYLKEKNLSSMYKFENTYDFAYRVHSYLLKYGFKARRANPNVSST